MIFILFGLILFTATNKIIILEPFDLKKLGLNDIYTEPVTCSKSPKVPFAQPQM